jgi:hypothetical protein
MKLLTCVQVTNLKNLPKVLRFTPTTGRLHPGALAGSILGTDMMITLDNPFSYSSNTLMSNVQLNYEKMRQVVLSQGYDKAWIVEEDMVIPGDALERLLETDAEVVTGLYVQRHGYAPNIHLGAVKVASWPFIQSHWGETIDVAGGCLGCVMIDRSVLEDFSFILDEPGSGPDVPFMRHCVAKNIDVRARLDLVCGHATMSGDILWPDKTMGWMRIE